MYIKKIISFQFPLWDTRKPFARLQGFNILLSIPFMGYERESIIDRLMGILLSIPFMGYNYNYKNKIYNKKCFQFPLWDTASISSVEVNDAYHFQFPLWDT